MIRPQLVATREFSNSRTASHSLQTPATEVAISGIDDPVVCAYEVFDCPKTYKGSLPASGGSVSDGRWLLHTHLDQSRASQNTNVHFPWITLLPLRLRFIPKAGLFTL